MAAVLIFNHVYTDFDHFSPVGLTTLDKSVAMARAYVTVD